MKILVYGAGVIGCYLTHVLCAAGNNVTLLARGSWRETLERDGLTIVHHLQKKTTHELFALAFIAPYLASEKRIAPDVVKEMMERSLYRIRWYFSRTDLNTPHGKVQHKKAIMAYCKWYTPERERDYPSSFKVDFEGHPYEGACYYRITRCPICAYARRLGVMEIMPLLCKLDEVMIRLQHGVLHREQMIASGGTCCDYFVVGDKENHR